MRHPTALPIRAAALAALALLGGCGGGMDEAAERPRERRETVFDDQLRALDRARDVERRMREADEARRRAIDAQSR